MPEKIVVPGASVEEPGKYRQYRLEEEEIRWSEIVTTARRWSFSLLRNWWKLLLVGLVAGAAGAMYAKFSPVSYNPRITFVLEEGSASGGGLSAIAGQFGIDMGAVTGGGSSMLSGDNIVGLLKSKRFTEEVLLTPFGKDSNYSLADRYADVYGLREAWKGNSTIAKEVFFPVHQPKESFTRLQDSLLQRIRDNILATVQVGRSDKKMSFFEVKTKFKDEALGKYFTERLVNKASEFYIETRTRRLRTNVERLQRRADSIHGLLNSRTYATASAQSRLLDINPAYQTATVSAELSSRDKSMVGVIYAELVKNLEIQKATLTQETPVVEVVDAVELPLARTRRGALMHAVLFAAIASSLAAIFFLIKDRSR